MTPNAHSASATDPYKSTLVSGGTRRYDVVAVRVPIVFNFDGDHDHNGMIYALARHKDALDDIRQHFAAHAKTPHPLVRPLVLRARCGETVEVRFTNHIQGRCVGMHLVGDGYDVRTSDGAAAGANPSSLAGPGQTLTYTWHCRHEGVFPFHDMGDLSGGEEGTNVHGLFGALVVEPPEAEWTDPVTGQRLDVPDDHGYTQGDGLYVDVHPKGLAAANRRPKCPLDKAPEQPMDPNASFREYAIFFHDEPEFAPPHERPEPPLCPPGEGGRHGSPEGPGAPQGHGGHAEDEPPPIMPISYRAEPMVNRERKLWRMIRQGTLTKPVIGEEQHHSSWLYGDPATPILFAYQGDPMRLRLVHGGVKETHVFHLHVYQWYAAAEDVFKDPKAEDPDDRPHSPLIDSISISPQTGHTIIPLYGAGTRQGAIGDAIWHCHLYPHFHEGMWGILRTFDRRQDGTRDYPHDAETPPEQRKIAALHPLPDRQPPPDPTADRPGFPNFIAGQLRQKSPVPPWPEDLDGFGPLPADLDYRPITPLERNALNTAPAPGALFIRFPFEASLPVMPRELAVITTDIVYNNHGWYDPQGHTFVTADAATDAMGARKEPLVFRGNQNTVMQITLENRLPPTLPGTPFDPPFPPCDTFGLPLAECGLHVHLVKFDPLVSDGASVGWNYLSGPRVGKKMVYRWYVDEAFGTVFFHDHLFANFRQKHGLFGAMIAEPAGAKALDPSSHEPIETGLAAVVVPGREAGDAEFEPFREFCFALADFIPLFDRHGTPLNPPPTPGHHGDQGVMAVNYRNEPVRERRGDPAYWFHSRRHAYPWGPPSHPQTVDIRHGDPATDVFESYPNDPIRIHLFQGSHEEQHSFQVHGMRWRQFLGDAGSPLRNQQTLGISEAFDFDVTPADSPYGPGDYLWKSSPSDDLWLGVWGLIRVHRHRQPHLPALPGKEDEPIPDTVLPAPSSENTRGFRVVAEQRPLVYREPDLVDPFALVYRLTATRAPGSDAWVPVSEDATVKPIPGGGPPCTRGGSGWYTAEPLILRCRQGEWVELELHNALPTELRPEPFAPEVPLERPDRPVSRQVSLHADLLRYDVRDSDGANVGVNPIQSLPPGAPPKTYRWYADREVGPVLLQDMADFRNHRHHGLVGALIVEPEDVTLVRPLAPRGRGVGAEEAWYGARATLYDADGRCVAEEAVLILQDGLRLFLNGNLAFPAPDEPPGVGEERPDPEDQGQKGFNYRSEPVGGPRGMHLPAPATPVFHVPAGAPVWFRLVVGADKPRNHSFTIHGHTWPAWRPMSGVPQRVGAVSALSSGSVETFDITTPGLAADHQYRDYAYRTGVFRWALSHGLWGLLRAHQAAD